MNKPLLSATTAVSLVFIGSWILGLMIHRYFVPALVGIILIGTGIVLYSTSWRSLARIAGLSHWHRNLFLYVLLGVIIGFGLVCLYAAGYHSTVAVPVFSTATIIAPIIGITEELIFRGFVQGVFKDTKALAGILTASVGHSIYKVCVIGTYTEAIGANLLQLFLFTFFVGIMFGFLRKWSKNLIPAAVAHGCFDIFLYGSFSLLPGWVWN